MDPAATRKCSRLARECDPWVELIRDAADGDDDSAALASSLVKKEVERLQLPANCQVIAEPWPYGSDESDST